MKNLVLYLIFLFLIPVCVSSQQFILQGTVVNSKTGIPVENVNVKVLNTVFGNATNKQGRFEVVVPVLPAVVEVTCIGFESVSIEITKMVTVPIEINLQPSIHELEGITISDSKAIPLYEDPDYSVLDYEIMGDNLLILVYKYQLKRSMLVLLTRLGDTLALARLPETPPDKLYKDPLGYVHFFSKKRNAYQCYYDKSLGKLEFPYVYPVDTILGFFTNYQFFLNNRMYFQENSPDGFSTLMGFFDKANGKKYLQVSGDSKLAKDYYGDINYFLSPRRPDDTSQYLRGFQMRAFELFYKPKSIACMVKTRNNMIAVFDFTKDTLQLRNADWELISSCGFSFHKEVKENLLTTIAAAYSGSNWKWKWSIITDEFSGTVYTSFEKRGSEKLCKIDIQTGELDAEFVVPVLFPAKINIYKGEAFFMYKKIGETEKWRLYKMKL
jgi:hypothetical protein